MTVAARAEFAEAARLFGWSVTENAHGADGTDSVSYERYGDQVLVAWAPDGTVAWAVKNYGNDDQSTVRGQHASASAREWIEEPA